jgi:hypothetical protein
MFNKAARWVQEIKEIAAFIGNDHGREYSAPDSYFVTYGNKNPVPVDPISQ